MKLLTKAQFNQLVKNGENRTGTSDLKPVVKLFNPSGAATWLLTEITPDNPDIAFGLCDLGMGEPELGYVSLNELAGIRLRFGLGIERDIWFEANKTIKEYADEARDAGRIVA